MSKKSITIVSIVVVIIVIVIGIGIGIAKAAEVHDVSVVFHPVSAVEATRVHLGNNAASVVVREQHNVVGVPLVNVGDLHVGVEHAAVV
jgi:hypothetical protein